jgi:excisionase family DNA binding protein
LLTTQQAAAHLGVSVENIRRLVNAGHLDARRLHPRARLRIALEAVEQLADRNAAAA